MSCMSARCVSYKINTAVCLVPVGRRNDVCYRSDICAGETFAVSVDPRLRTGIAGDFQKASLTLPPDWTIVEEEPEANDAIRFTISVPEGLRLTRGSDSLLRELRKNSAAAEATARALLPQPPPLLTAIQDALLSVYAFTAASPVTPLPATSTLAHRIAPRRSHP